MPASDALFEREKNRRELSTPEMRAAFQAALKDAVGKIADRDTQRLYFSDLMSRANAHLRAQRPPFVPFTPRQPGDGPYKRGAPPPAPATPELKAIAGAARPRPAAEGFLRAAIDQPEVLTRYSNWIERLDIADPDLEAIRNALLGLAETTAHAENDAPSIDRDSLSLHLSRSGQERAAARIERWKHEEKPPGRKGEPNTGPGASPSEWLAVVTREVVLPAIREELSELQAAAAEGDDDAFVRFQALSREARLIEARAREAKLEEPTADTDDADGLVA